MSGDDHLLLYNLAGEEEAPPVKYPIHHHHHHHDEEPTEASTVELSSSDETVGGSSSDSTVKCETSEAIQPTTESQSKSVTFSDIEVREYPIIPGDNPGGVIGVPVTMAWEFEGPFGASVDDYEDNRPPRRNMREMNLPSMERDRMLRSVGFSRQDLMASLKQANISRYQRRRTVDTIQMGPMLEKLELVRRAVANATVRRAAKRRERAYLAPYNKHGAVSKPNELEASMKTFVPSDLFTSAA